MQLLFAMASSFKYVYINAHMLIYILWNYKKKGKRKKVTAAMSQTKKIPENNLDVCVFIKKKKNSRCNS